ncbi:type IV secretion protein Rhs, partial [Enterobacter hormaechei]|nr:type IV secretion protein Rhs [Enterobacter hormaechei]MBI8993720.1 type IV secretion protein Rhs [Enterobacter hormaechei]
KGDLARKVAGALGIKVRNEIVLESGGNITLKVGGSFVVIHAGGVDITGPKISLNSGGSPGTPVPILQPAVLGALADEGDDGSDANDTNDAGNSELPRKNVQDTFNSPPGDLVPPQLRRIFSR